MRINYTRFVWIRCLSPKDQMGKINYVMNLILEVLLLSFSRQALLCAVNNGEV